MIILEDRRNELISKSKRGKKEKDGLSRYEKRTRSRVANTVRSFNEIDMDQLFRKNILTVSIPVTGETDDYLVTISFGSVLDEIQREIKKNNDKLELKSILRALMNAFNSDNVYIRCNCPDARFRFAYWQSVNDIITGPKENRPAKITNPNNDLGPCCKHTALVLSNTSFLIKVASVINNYIHWFEKNRKKQYADIIYPAVFGKKYEEPVQLSIDDKDTLDTSKSDIDTSNEYGRTRTQFKPGNTYRYQKKLKPDPNQTQLDDINNKESEE